MHVVENKPHGIIADRLDLHDRDVLFAADSFPLGCRMPLHFGARAHHAQIFGGEIEGVSRVKGYSKRVAFLLEADFGWPRILCHA
jgi:hypothetical protein